MNQTDFGQFKKGGKASAGALTRHADRLRDLTPMIGGTGINVQTSKAGTTISNPVTEKRGAFVRAKITAVIVGKGGQYKAKSIRGTVNVEETGNLVTGTFGTLFDIEDLVVWFLGDVDQGSSHALSVGALVEGRAIGSRIDGKLVVLVSSAGGGDDEGVYQYTGRILAADGAPTTWDFWMFGNEP